MPCPSPPWQLLRVRCWLDLGIKGAAKPPAAWDVCSCTKARGATHTGIVRCLGRECVGTGQFSIIGWYDAVGWWGRSIDRSTIRSR